MLGGRPSLALAFSGEAITLCRPHEVSCQLGSESANACLIEGLEGDEDGMLRGAEQPIEEACVWRQQDAFLMRNDVSQGGYVYDW